MSDEKLLYTAAFNDQLTPSIEKVFAELDKIKSGFDALSALKPFDGINSAISVLQERLPAVDKLGDKGKNTGRKIGDGMDEAKKKTESLLDTFSKFGMAYTGITSAVSALKDAFSGIFSEGMSRQNAVSDFETLLGSKDEAVKYAEDLRNSAAAALYGTEAINESAKSMLAYGIDRNTALEMQNVLGDIAMGDKNKMNSLAMAFSQMAGLGKLQGQDWEQMVGAGFNPFAQMEKDLGKTQEQLQDMMAEGQISADMVKQAFINATKEGGQYFNSMQGTIEGTLSGKLAVLQSRFDDLKAKLFEVFEPVANAVLPILTDKVLPAVNKIIEKITPFLTETAAFLSDTLFPVMEAVGGFIFDNIDVLGVFAGVIMSVAGALKIWTAVQTVLNAVMTANPVGLVVVAIAALVAMVYKVIDAWDRWGAAMTLVLGPLYRIINLIMTLKTHWDSIVKSFTDGGIWAGIKRTGVVLLDCVLKPLMQILDVAARITGWDWVESLHAKVKNLRESFDLVTEGEKSAPESETGSVNKELENDVNQDRKSAPKYQPLGNIVSDGVSAVSSGGTRNTQITINLGKMIETVNFNGTPQENAQDLTDKVTEILLRSLYSAETAV